MATFKLQIIPEQTSPTPGAQALAAARDLLQSYLDYFEEKPRITLFQKPTLVDTGAAFESMQCPLCDGRIARYEDDDHDEWWYDMEDKIHASSEPTEVLLTMPCCSGELKAGALAFGKQAAFVNWMLSVHEYELQDGRLELDQTQLAEIGRVLGAPVRQLLCVNG